MIWIICFSLAIVSIGFAVREIFKQERFAIKFGIVLACMAMATFIIYIPVFFNRYSVIAAFFANLINVFQVISLDSDIYEGYEIIQTAIDNNLIKQVYLFIVGLLHFIMPVLSLLLVYSIVKDCYSDIVVALTGRKKRPLYIFTALNEQTLILARDIKGKNKNCDIVFISEDDMEAEAGIGGKFTCKKGKISDLKTYTIRKEISYFCMSDNEEHNLSDAIYLIGQYSKLPEEIQMLRHIFICSSSEDADLVLDSCEKGIIDIRRIDIDELVAYELLNRYPVYDYIRKNDIDILLYGLGKINRHLLRTIYWCCLLDGHSLHVNVIGRDIGDAVRDFARHYPDVYADRNYVTFIDCPEYADADKAVMTAGINADIIAVDSGPDMDNLDEAIRIRRLMYYRDESRSNRPAIFVHVRDSKLGGMVQSLRTSELKEERRVNYDLIPFGTDDDVYTYGSIIDSDIESMSRCIHLEYEDIFATNEIDVTDALRRYNLLEVNKRSNRANAMHIKYKLASLGLDCREGDSEDRANYEELMTEVTLNRLARLEHVRWMRFLQSEGWTTAGIDEVNAYKASGISGGRHNCQLLRAHPYICDYDALKDRSDKLGLEDSTVYDIELVKRIPEILHDRWGVSGKKYYIVQNKEQQG